ncbi:hypothetical protein NPIL_191941 [Nephila pilipes]|uniref:Uncharacterized protein n=1 Tax=Nephila pilipes TaxID=299642 RepID=A0A8X6PC17_NEPPI|nr:hypothetical protein NPIL_191941 [Nephila pilipes]
MFASGIWYQRWQHTALLRSCQCGVLLPKRAYGSGAMLQPAGARTRRFATGNAANLQQMLLGLAGAKSGVCAFKCKVRCSVRSASARAQGLCSGFVRSA